MENELMTVGEVGKLLRVPASWIYARTCDGAHEVLPHLKFGRHLRFERERIVAWMETRRRGVEPSGMKPQGVEKRQ